MEKKASLILGDTFRLSARTAVMTHSWLHVQAPLSHTGTVTCVPTRCDTLTPAPLPSVMAPLHTDANTRGVISHGQEHVGHPSAHRNGDMPQNFCTWHGLHEGHPLWLCTAHPAFSAVAQSCLTLRPHGLQLARLPVHHQLLEPAQTHVHGVSDATQPPHPLLSPSPPTFSLFQHQGLF